MDVLGFGDVPGWLFFIVIIGIVWYRHLNRNNDYWKKVGIPYQPASSIFSFFKVLLTKPLHQSEIEKYKKYGRIYGIFELSQPMMIIGDPDLLRDILVKDFHAFSQRREFVFGNPTVDNMVFFLNGEQWKTVRTLITPAFTSGKMRKMTNIINTSSKTVVQNFLSAAEKGIAVNCQRMLGAFTVDVIASSAFATKIDSHNDPNNPFAVHARNVFTKGAFKRIVLFLLVPDIIRKIFGIEIFESNAIQFFRDVSLQVIDERKRKGQKGNDFLQMMMDAAEGQLEPEKKMDGFKMMDVDEDCGFGHGEENDKVFKSIYQNKTLSQDELLAQCVMFFMVGYETTASTLSFTVYHLALNPECQEKLIKEIDETFQHMDELTYEAVRDMKYLNCVVSETLRMCPPVLRGERVTMEDYKLGDTGIIIPKDTLIAFPIYAMQHDPDFFPDPEKFDPDRFSAENRYDHHPYAYLPFGAGPKNCLGMRFSLMEIKLCLANVLRHIRFVRCPETQVPLEFNFAQGFLQPKQVMLTVEKRNDVPVV